MMNNKPFVSIVVLSFNTKHLLDNCIASIDKTSSGVKYEVIVCDNGSIDGSVELIKSKYKKVKLVENKENLGFAAGNNRARNFIKGKYVLFLNSDTKMRRDTLAETLKYLEKNEEVAAITCKLTLPSGELDKDARRSFPTPWVALTHFAYLDRLFPSSPIFSKYWYGYKNADEIQEVDVLEGAYCLIKKSVLDEVDWFDEDYFLDAEDIDLCWKIKNLGYKIVYYPNVSILHIKKASKRKQKPSSVVSGMNAMELFYKKRLWDKYPLIVNYLVILGVGVLKVIRLIKLNIFR